MKRIHSYSSDVDNTEPGENGAGGMFRPHGLGWPNLQDSSEMEREETFSPARKLLRQLLQSEVDRMDLNVDLPFKGHRASTLLPDFDPENEDYTVKAWLRKLEQFADIYNWDQKSKSFYLQEKLRGQARKWYNRLDDYNYTWEQWKDMLLRAFSKPRDYSTLIEEMIGRRKLPSESMRKYYQDKVALCFRCKLSDAASVSCIIKGLPTSLQTNALAFQCKRPDELYEHFLSALDNYHPPNTEARNRYHLENSKQPLSRGINVDTDPCPRCKKTGHALKNCAQPDTRECFKCKQQGHIALCCPMLVGHSQNKDQREDRGVKEVKLIQNYSDIYKKIAKVNNTNIKAYLDTGSEVNILAKEVSQLLELKETPITLLLKGFGGGMITCTGEVMFHLEVDNIYIECSAYVTNIDMGGIHLLIGQPVINRNGISMNINNGMAMLIQDLPVPQDVVAEQHKFKVITATAERLPPGSSIIKVLINGNKKGNDVATAARHYELQGVSYSLPATLLMGYEGYIKVVNTGAEDVVWLPGEVLSRAESCKPTSQDGQV